MSTYWLILEAITIEHTVPILLMLFCSPIYQSKSNRNCSLLLQESRIKTMKNKFCPNLSLLIVLENLSRWSQSKTSTLWNLFLFWIILNPCTDITLTTTSHLFSVTNLKDHYLLYLKAKGMFLRLFRSNITFLKVQSLGCSLL